MYNGFGLDIRLELFLLAPLRFSSCTPNFLIPKTDIYFLFEKGHCDYSKSGSGSVLRIHQSRIESFFFSIEGVYWK